nr:hypothetical protein CFP56_10968 [Quercus suber]POE87742.1 hypothetical protein CFP56_10971 [Quercus suber]POF00884.1 hypothetical protein CFP56_20832 [Quercus suber]
MTRLRSLHRAAAVRSKSAKPGPDSNAQLPNALQCKLQTRMPFVVSTCSPVPGGIRFVQLMDATQRQLYSIRRAMYARPKGSPQVIHQWCWPVTERRDQSSTTVNQKSINSRPLWQGQCPALLVVLLDAFIFFPVCMLSCHRAGIRDLVEARTLQPGHGGMVNCWLPPMAAFAHEALELSHACHLSWSASSPAHATYFT